MKKRKKAQVQAPLTLDIDQCIARLMEGFSVESVRQLAERLGVTPQAIHSIKSREDGYFPLRYVMEWVNATNGSVDYLLFGRGGADHANLKELITGVSKCPLIFSKEWFKGNGIELGNDKIRYLLGSSISSGKASLSDIFLVDTEAGFSDGLFVLQINDMVMLREVKLRIDGKIEIDKEVLENKSKKEITVLGRVVWRGNLLV